jgi:hypothetical protein
LVAIGNKIRLTNVLFNPVDLTIGSIESTKYSAEKITATVTTENKNSDTVRVN